MSLEMLQRLFEQLPGLDQRRLRLLRFTENRTTGTVYESRAIKLHTDSEMDKFLDDIKAEYIGKRKRLNQYTAVERYDGSVVGTTIYTLPCSDTLLGAAYGRMADSLAQPKVEGDPVAFRANAYALQGTWDVQEGSIPVMLVAVMDPFKKLKHKFTYEQGEFKAITENVLDLRLYADVIVVGQTVYFLGMGGEKLFGMERAYQANAEKLADTFSKVAFLSDAVKLKETALSGHFPRMLVSYQSSKLNYLNDLSKRRAIAEKFEIGIRRDGTLDTEDPKSAGKLLRFLCNKGMLDPTDQSAMEVTGAKRWAS